SIAMLPATAVSAIATPSYVAPGGAPSSAKAKRCKPAGAPSTAFGTGSAQSGVGPSANRATRAPAGAATSAMARPRPATSPRRAATGSVLAPDRFDGDRRAFAQHGLFRHARLGRGERGVLRGWTSGELELGLSFRRHAQRRAHRIVELETQLARLRPILRHDRK